jgi:hypothetical protein
VPQGSQQSSHFKQAWVIIFILGIIMLNFPFIHIFNKNTTVLGFPLLILYFFIGWPTSILVVYLFSRKINNISKDKSGPDPGEEPE